jgi:hypothetical protein
MLTLFGEQERKPQQLMSKDIQGPLAVPLLDAPDHQRVVAGTRQFAVAWTNGTPPFVTTLETAAGTLTIGPAKNPEHRASALLRLEVGRYEVRVSDLLGATRSAHIDVVPAPPALDETGLADAPDDIRLAMEAVQLARIDDGHWRLEAFQRLADVGPGQGAARLLTARLVAGRSLEDPNK